MRFLILISSLLLFSCANAPNESPKLKEKPITKKVTESIPYNPEPFERTKILSKLKSKIKNSEPLIAHVFVPLCDNEYQGIVPVSSTLGNGFNPKSNLYWGALYGVFTHFRKSNDWKLIHKETNVNSKILERVVFEKKFSNDALVYLVADAYQGDKMKVCVEDYLNSLAGNLISEIQFNKSKLGIHSHADLLVFNGHNGLMDVTVDPIKNEDNIEKDAAVIGCVSYDYFRDHLLYGKGFPILTTTNLMAPEAYNLEALLNGWANLENGNEIRELVAHAYHKYQKCGVNGARRLFKTGW